MKRPLTLIDSEAATRELTDALFPDLEDRVIGLDVEEDRMVHYHPRIALIQISADGQDWIVDPFAMERDTLAPIVEALCLRPRAVRMHGAQNDVTGLKRDFGVGPELLQDTQIAARLAGHRSFGLAGLLEHHFGVTLEKEMRMSDWTARPLSAQQIDYARRDTVWLNRLWEALVEAVRNRGLDDALEEENAALAALPANPPSFDPGGWRSLKGLRNSEEATPMAERRAEALWLWRERTAREEDAHPTRVLPPWLLVQLALRGEGLLTARKPPRGLRTFLRRVDDTILHELLRNPPPVCDEAVSGPRPGGRRPRWARHPDFDARLERLLAWRNAQSEALGLEAGFLAPRALLEQIADVGTAAPDHIARIPDVRKWRCDRFMDDWLAALKGR